MRGFYSKDLLLDASSSSSTIIYLVFVAGCGMSVIYCWKLIQTTLKRSSPPLSHRENNNHLGLGFGFLYPIYWTVSVGPLLDIILFYEWVTIKPMAEKLLGVLLLVLITIKPSLSFESYKLITIKWWSTQAISWAMTIKPTVGMSEIIWFDPSKHLSGLVSSSVWVVMPYKPYRSGSTLWI